MTGIRSTAFGLFVGGALINLSASAADLMIKPADPEPILLRPLEKDVYWSKEGGNVAVLAGRKGVVLFDTTRSGARANELQSRIAEITTKPLKAVIVSHIDEDHVGGLVSIPSSVQLIAQRATGALLDSPDVAAKESGTVKRRSRLDIDRHVSMQIGGERVEIYHWGPAHTAGDLVVWLPRQRIVFAADIFCMDQPRPYIKLELGGSSEGWVQTAQRILALHPRWVVVGHGEPQRPEFLKSYVERAIEERASVLRLAAEGKPRAEIEALVGEPQPSSIPLAAGAHEARFASVVLEEFSKQ
jgi:glyoxylase-like metal-dependent hydrolase (beta-lactamase superfamily II)